MLLEKPYFMTNKEWYYVDQEDPEFGYKLTRKAPKKAKESYDEFYGIGNKSSGDFDIDR